MKSENRESPVIGKESQPARAVGIEILCICASTSRALRSQPARAVGIEMSRQQNVSRFWESQPARAVGIEITSIRLITSLSEVTAREGCGD